MAYQVIIIEDDPMVAAIDRQYVEMNRAFRVGQVLDYYPPSMDGMEFVDRLHAMGQYPAIIMVTSANDREIVQGLLSRGVLDYLVKPFAFARFRQAMDKFLQTQNLLSCPQESSLLDQQAIDRLRSFLSASRGQALTSEEIAEQVHLSRITIRRYVNYMVETGELASSIDYQTGGRPSIRYSYTGEASEP